MGRRLIRMGKLIRVQGVIMMTVWFTVKSGILALALVLALYDDIRAKKIRNMITLPAAGTGLIINCLEQGPGGFLFSLSGWIVPVALLITFYRINVMGAGDIKLFAALGAIMGLPFALYSFLFSVYFGAVIAVVMLVRRQEFLKRMTDIYGYFSTVMLTRRLYTYGNPGDQSSKFVFSAAIVPGTLAYYLISFVKEVS